MGDNQESPDHNAVERAINLTEPYILADRKGIISWAIYDWANSAFPTVVITFVFATYFTQGIAANKILGTSQWGYTMSLSAMVVAILSPVFGAIADQIS